VTGTGTVTVIVTNCMTELPPRKALQDN
jgi:hypothetical protein